jgi:acyl-CoA reductase-like NAD-dependent aldehyde dehydrogenase
MLDFGMMIGGRKTAAAETFAVFNPATGALVGEAPNASLADLDDAVTAAQQAFPSWSRMPDADRQVACAALAGKLGEHAEDIARLLTLGQADGGPGLAVGTGRGAGLGRVHGQPVYAGQGAAGRQYGPR